MSRRTLRAFECAVECVVLLLLAALVAAAVLSPDPSYIGSAP